jgi:hypothetical protein
MTGATATRNDSPETAGGNVNEPLRVLQIAFNSLHRGGLPR